MRNIKIPDPRTIGGRMYLLRTEKGSTQEQIADEMHIKRQTLSKWENNESSPTVDDLMNLCEIFNCDFGFLVGEYACRKRQNTDVHEHIGLSEAAINTLSMMNTIDQKESLQILSSLICNPYFQAAIQQASKAVNIAGECKARDIQIKEAKPFFSSADYYELHALTDEAIKNESGITSKELQAADIAMLFRLSAIDSLQSALKDVLERMVSHGID